VNRIVQYQQVAQTESDRVDRAFAALSDPTRRAVLERLGRGSASISDLAAPFGMTLTGMKKHVGILEDAGLVATEKVGRSRLCRLDPDGPNVAELWIEKYRSMLESRLDRLGELIEKRSKGER